MDNNGMIPVETTNSPDQLVATVKAKEDFVRFLAALRTDYQDNPGSWQNQDLSSYLEAVEAWVDDMEGFFAHQGERCPQMPTWRLLAQMLLAGKVYE